MLRSIRRLSDHLYRFTDTCHVYILVEGDEAVLIDFGAGDVLDALPAMGVRRVTDVLMTHHHRDQGQGLPRLAQAGALAAGARLWAPYAEQDLFAQVDVHWQGRSIYNNYNVRQDRFSLLEPVPIAGVLADYETRRFGRHVITIIPTPGHTTGSVSLLADVDGRSVAFIGDLMAGPGKLWSLAATQWTYNGGEGLPFTVLSCLDLKARGLDVLLSSHGEPIEDVAGGVDVLVARLAELMWLRKQNPRLFILRDHPYAPITAGGHLLRNRSSLANSYVLRSDTGKALFIDFGYDFMAGPAAGDDRASRRPWLYTLPALKAQYGVSRIDAVLPTHYHDDHVAGCNLLRAVEGSEVWAAETFADILERPAAYDLPCLWYDPIPVDRRVPVGTPVRWEEYELTLFPLPGHTRYAVAVSFEVDGVRVLATGDQHQDDDGIRWNYVYQNRFAASDYRQAAELFQRLAPQLILPGHAEPQWVAESYLPAVSVRAEALELLHQQLLPESPDLGAEGFLARLTPYQATTCGTEPVAYTAEVRNPFGTTAEAVVQVVVPEGWAARAADVQDPASGGGALRLALGPGQTGAVHFCVTPAGAQPARRVRVGLDVTVADRRFGQQAEALIDVTPCT